MYTNYIHNVYVIQVFPHKHRLRLPWPRTWWPEGAENDFLPSPLPLLPRYNDLSPRVQSTIQLASELASVQNAYSKHAIESFTSTATNTTTLLPSLRVNDDDDSDAEETALTSNLKPTASTSNLNGTATSKTPILNRSSSVKSVQGGATAADVIVGDTPPPVIANTTASNATTASVNSSGKAVSLVNTSARDKIANWFNDIKHQHRSEKRTNKVPTEGTSGKGTSGKAENNITSFAPTIPANIPGSDMGEPSDAAWERALVKRKSIKKTSEKDTQSAITSNLTPRGKNDQSSDTGRIRSTSDPSSAKSVKGTLSSNKATPTASNTLQSTSNIPHSPQSNSFNAKLDATAHHPLSDSPTKISPVPVASGSFPRAPDSALDSSTGVDADADGRPRSWSLGDYRSDHLEEMAVKLLKQHMQEGEQNTLSTSLRPNDTTSYSISHTTTHINASPDGSSNNNSNTSSGSGRGAPVVELRDKIANKLKDSKIFQAAKDKYIKLKVSSNFYMLL